MLYTIILSECLRCYLGYAANGILLTEERNRINFFYQMQGNTEIRSHSLERCNNCMYKNYSIISPNNVGKKLYKLILFP